MTRQGNRAIALAAMLLTMTLLAAWWRQMSQPTIKSITPTLTGQPELCLTCHAGIEEISPSHPVEAFGCTTCHGGDRLALEADVAHAGMFGGRNPSDLAVVEVACGGAKCHSGDPATARDHIQRVMRSTQATYAGAIAQVRYTFGAQPDLTPRMSIHTVQDDEVLSPSAVLSLAAFVVGETDPQPLRQFSANCLNCHLSSQPVAEPYFYHATGCAACHVLYSDDGLYEGGDPTISPDAPGHARQHRLTSAIPYTQCNHCHNRGNYNLPRMAFFERDDLPPPDYYNAAERRLADYYQPIGRFTRCEWVLDCIDCHSSREAMGDGDIYRSQVDAWHIHQCRTCHGTLWAPPALATITDPEDVALRQATVNGNYALARGDRVVVTGRGEKWGHVKLVGDQLVLTMKATGQVYTVPLVQGTACEQKPDQQESHYCHECHAYER